MYVGDEKLLFATLLRLEVLVNGFSQMRILLPICSIQLQDKLTEKDKELKTMKLDLELQERATEAKIAEKIAGTVGERLTDGCMAHTVPVVAIWRGLVNVSFIC